MQENQIEPFCFTDEQKKVLDLSFGQHLVLAAPGTGKTELLAHRIVQAFENGVSPHRMLCLTFTVRAAQNMMDRVHQYLPGVDMEVGNIHSFCSRLLHEKKLIPQATSIIDQQTKHEWIADICGDLTPQEVIRLKKCSSGHGFVDDSNLSLPVSQIASVCSLLNRSHSGVPDSLIKPSMRKIKVYRECYEIAVKLSHEYFRLKQERMVLDYEDLLTDAYLFLSDNQQTANSFDWIQIDEVQDLSPLQWAIIDLLKSDGAHAVYFGDIEQAIFSFMGASVSQLNNVAMKCEIHNLQKNFRSPSYLLDVFIRYAIKNLNPNWSKLPLPYRTQKPEASDLALYNCGTNLYEEADFISSLLASESSEKKSAILVRYNKSADIIAKKLTKNAIDFFKISGFDLFDRTYMRDLKAYFSAIVSPFDFMAWSRLFKLFGRFKTQKESMAFTQSIYALGLLPTDFLDPYVDFNFPLKTLVDIFYDERVVVFDTETTGLDIYTDDIIQIAAVEYLSGKKGREFEVYIKTSKNLANSEKIHHISQSVLDAKGVEPRSGLQSFCDFVGESVLVAHNLQFDISILKANLSRSNLEFLAESTIMFDTLELSRRLFPERSSYKLEDLLDDFGIQGVNSHNALDDVHATGNLLMFIVGKVFQSNLAISINDVMHSKKILTFRNNFLPLWLRLCQDVRRESTIRDETLHFFDYCISNNYFDCPDEATAFPTEDFYSEIDKFLVFADEKYKRQPFLGLLSTVKKNLSQMKETDLLLGNESVVISTIHKAKGLEFDRVIIPECISGVYPGYQFLHHSAAECDLEEEARVLYVGLTRARQQLVILYHEEKKRGSSKFIEPVADQFSTCDVFISKSGCDNVTYFHNQNVKSDWLLRYRNVLDVANSVVDFNFPLLEKSINDEDWSVRIAAIDAFTKLDVKSASGLICKKLDDDNPKVKCTAIRSLVKLRYKELLPFVLIFVGKEYPQTVRVESIRAIATIGDCSSLVNFDNLITDELEEIRFESISALSNFNGPRVTELLMRALYDQSPHVRLKSSQILCELGFTKWEGVIKGDSYDWYRMGEQEELDIDHVISLLETYQKVDAVRCLGNSNNDHATDKLLALAGEKYLDSETLEALVEAFGNLRCEKAVKFLKRKIDSGYAFLKLRIAAAFRKIGGEYSIPPLSYMLSDLSPDVRLYSAKSLELLEVADWSTFVKGVPDDFGRLGETLDSAMVPLLIHRYRDRALRNDNGPIRKLIALSLFKLGRVEWKDIFLGDDDDWVRLCTQAPAGSNGLLHLLLKDQNPVIRVKASRGLLSLGEDQWIDLVKGDKFDWKRMAEYLKGRK